MTLYEVLVVLPKDTSFMLKEGKETSHIYTTPQSLLKMLNIETLGKQVEKLQVIACNVHITIRG